MTGTVGVAIFEKAELPAVNVTYNPDPGGPGGAHRIPRGLVESYFAALKALYDVGDTIVEYAKGAAEAANPTPLPAGSISVGFGDPRYCWNVVRHIPHDFRYQVGDRAGAYYCDGNGEFAARVLGYDLNPED